MSVARALVIVTSSFPITGDGSEAAGAFVAELARELARDMPVKVVAPGTSESIVPWEEQISLYRYYAPARALSTLRFWHPIDALALWRVLRSGSRMTELAASDGPVAHVLALWALPCGEWARRSASAHGLEYSVWTLGSDIWRMGRLPIVRSRLRRVLAHARQCWSDGLKLAADTQAIAGRPVGFLPSTRQARGVSAQKSNPEQGRRILYLGRWHPNKGIDLLLESLRLLDEQSWGRIAELRIAGGGGMQALVVREVAELQAQGRPVVLDGYLDADEASQALNAADIVVIPSRIESIPLIFSDAVRSGCAVIATPVGDLPALIAGSPSCGVLANAVTAAAIAEAVAKALREPHASFAEGIAARAAEFDLSTVARRIRHELGL